MMKPPIDQNAPTSHQLKLPAQPPRSRRFISLRWQVLIPILMALLLVLMFGAYGISYNLLSAETQDDRTLITEAGRAVAENAIGVGRLQRTEVDRIAFTQGVPEGIVARDGSLLQPLIEPLAALSNLDLVVVGDARAEELMGLQRVVVSGSIDYAVTAESNLSSLRSVQNVLAGADSATEIIGVERRTMLVTAGPVLQNGQVVGVVLVGTDINRVLADLGRGTTSELALFTGLETLLLTSLEDEPRLDPQIYTRTLANPSESTFERLELDGQNYQAVYFPLVVGQTPLGVVGVYRPQDEGFAAEVTRQLLSLFFALVVAVVAIVGSLAVGRSYGRMTQLREAVDGMAEGKQSETGLRPDDEIGELGAAVDRFAAAARVQVNQLQGEVRQQRRQLNHLNAILESLSDGILVQDEEGRVLTMNAAARRLLGVYGNTEAAAQLRLWAATLQTKTNELASGIFELAETSNFKIDNRLVQVRAALVESVGEKRLGTVLTLRDITNSQLLQAQRDDVVAQLSRQISTQQLASAEAITRQFTATHDSLQKFAQEINQEARGMQRLITEYHDLTVLQANELRLNPISVLDLLMSLAGDWQSIASATELELSVNLPNDEGLHILGDEKRLLMGLGYLLDNAIKYSDGRGEVKLETRVKNEFLVIKISDQGAGINAEDLPNVFTRFYRGKPQLPNGDLLTVGGSGQGLYFANQVIEAHGGQIVLASVQGEGTQVSVYLPLTADVNFNIDAEVAQEEEKPVAETVSRSIWDLPTSAMQQYL